MAQKKKTAQRAPRAAEPRMYGDGKSSQESAAATPAAQPEPAARTAGVTTRAGTYARVDRITDYSYVKRDLRRLGITAAGILAVLVVLGVLLP